MAHFAQINLSAKGATQKCYYVEDGEEEGTEVF